eukprot:TRINITY_DN25_c2_g2_i1.p1 TRINITY_DN25_c2_g2~~TRINITY_DN25_c2_g2_i1.p1  ORF type:complete len:227 (+),score=87.80 TRINITY_DN25_c2_g2_i1:133-813(+)
MENELGIYIAPSLLSGDFAQLASEANSMIGYGANWLHMDVMDGHFCPNLTIGAPVIKSLRKHTNAYLDCHLMVTNPDAWFDDFKNAGASGFTFHIEATGVNGGRNLAQKIKNESEMKVGIAVKPGTDVEQLFPLIDDGLVDMVLVMSVEPGFSGQLFMPEVVSKIEVLREKYPTLNIEVDGGVNEKTIDIVAKAGANIVVSGSCLFKSETPVELIESFKQNIQKYR